jgi:hypothetical protein
MLPRDGNPGEWGLKELDYRGRNALLLDVYLQIE